MEGDLNKEIIEERKRRAIQFLKQKTTLFVYVVLALITFLGIFIRTRNISKLKDITTGSWTLGPDLDPFLFLRWAKYIVEKGTLFAMDTMRSVPLADFCSGSACNAINTAREMKLLPYMMAWFHKFLSLFGLSENVTYSSILFPVVMFGLTTIAFFLFARKIFYKQENKTKNAIAIIATLFFVLIPSLLPRTIAGIPEKESVAFLFMFLGFYFFLEAFTSQNLKKGILFGVLSGVMTAFMALTWGGVMFIFFTIPLAIFLAFLFGKIEKREYFIYSLWLISSFMIMMPFSTRYNIINLIGSLSTGSGIAIFFMIGLSLLIAKSKKIDEIQRKTKIPKLVFLSILSIIILTIIVSVVFGPAFVFVKISGVKNSLVSPLTDRFILTVAENKQPYFTTDWKNDFGPIVWNVPLFFWLFFIGSVILFNSMIKSLSKKERIILTFGYFMFLICLIFSRYSSGSILNGTSGLSILVYFIGIIIFLGFFAYYYFKRDKENNFEVFKEFNFSYILYFIILTLGIIGSRSVVRLIMVLGAVSPVAIAFLIVKISKRFYFEKEDVMKFFVGALALVIIIASVTTLWGYYQTDKYTAENFAPGMYQWQWQEAMAWVRENTPVNSVFAHWWDYGYWVQSLGERATILDGGNAIVYWNHLLGRHVLTGTDEMESLKFLYTHKATHLLIDSTDIGKYTAFSSIGSDENYDRLSWINTFLMDETQTQETKDETTYIYMGGIVTDDDIIWYQDGQEIFIPRKAGGVGAIILKKDFKEEVLQPKAIFVYNGKQYIIPLRYLYSDGKLTDFGEGLDAGIFLFPSLDVVDNQVAINKIGAAFYLSKRTVHSELIRLYLFDEKSDYFKLAHTEDSYFIENLKQQGMDAGNFVYYQGFQGPTKIWEVKYPAGINSNPDYLELDYPNDNLWKAKEGEY